MSLENALKHAVINKTKINSVACFNSRLVDIVKQEDDWEFEIYYHDVIQRGGFSLNNGFKKIHLELSDEESIHLQLSDDV